jgi:hypothetical protein
MVACSSARYSANPQGGPTLTFPAHFAEGEGSAGKKAHADAGAPAASASAPSASAEPGDPTPGPPAPSVATPSTASSPPDPEPLVTADQWEYVLDYVKGRVTVASVRRVHLLQPVPTARRIGRFAVELRIGAELVERVRFDFPLLAADLPPSGPKRPLHEEPRFAPGAETTQTVLVPASDRATKATLIDRLTGDRWPLDWPPAPHAASALSPL